MSPRDRYRSGKKKNPQNENPQSPPRSGSSVTTGSNEENLGRAQVMEARAAKSQQKHSDGRPPVDPEVSRNIDKESSNGIYKPSMSRSHQSSDSQVGGSRGGGGGGGGGGRISQRSSAFRPQQPASAMETKPNVADRQTKEANYAYIAQMACSNLVIENRRAIDLGKGYLRNRQFESRHDVLFLHKYIGLALLKLRELQEAKGIFQKSLGLMSEGDPEKRFLAEGIKKCDELIQMVQGDDGCGRGGTPFEEDSLVLRDPGMGNSFADALAGVGCIPPGNQAPTAAKRPANSPIDQPMNKVVIKETARGQERRPIQKNQYNNQEQHHEHGDELIPRAENQQVFNHRQSYTSNRRTEGSEDLHTLENVSKARAPPSEHNSADNGIEAPVSTPKKDSPDSMDSGGPYHPSSPSERIYNGRLSPDDPGYTIALDTDTAEPGEIEAQMSQQRAAEWNNSQYTVNGKYSPKSDQQHFLAPPSQSGVDHQNYSPRPVTSGSGRPPLYSEAPSTQGPAPVAQVASTTPPHFDSAAPVDTVQAIAARTRRCTTPSVDMYRMAPMAHQNPKETIEDRMIYQISVGDRKELLRLIKEYPDTFRSVQDELMVIAAAFGFPSIACTLMDQKGHKVNGRNPKNDLVPLAAAAIHGCNAFAAAILQHEACRTDWRLKGGLAPLHLAVMFNQIRMVNTLLEHKADPNISAGLEYNHNTALHFAAEYGRSDIVHILMAAGASVNSRNSQRETALHIAARSNDVEMCRCLLKNGAKDDIKDKSGKTAKWLSESTDELSKLWSEHEDRIRELRH